MHAYYYGSIMDASDSCPGHRVGGMLSHVLAMKRHVEPYAYYEKAC